MDNASPARPKFYRPELDALRFVAFGLVFFHHVCASLAGDMLNAGGFQAEAATLAVAGGYGVDLFFLLSAYLITELFMRERAQTGAIDVPAFYVRRILRIWPLYFFFVFATLILSRFTPVQFPPGAVVPMLLFYGNWYFMTHAAFSPAGILWSVSIEEQFYLLCPLAVKFLSRRGLMLLATVLILIAVVARFVLLHSAAVSPQALWYCTFTRLDPIAIGMLTCLLLNGRVPRLAPAARAALMLGGLICLYGASTWLHGRAEQQTVMDGSLAYPLADCGVLAIFLAFLGAKFSWAPVIYLGQISYGLYVYHILALDIAKVGLLQTLGTCPFWLRALIAFPMTVGFAALSYAWLEVPLLQLKSRFRRLFPRPRLLPPVARDESLIG